MKLILTKKNLFYGEFLHLVVGDRSMIIKGIECGVQLNSQLKRSDNTDMLLTLKFFKFAEGSSYGELNVLRVNMPLDWFVRLNLKNIFQ